MTSNPERPRDLPHLLIVEDEPAARQAMFAFFGAQGWEVSSAATLIGAWDLARRIRFDVVLTDLSLIGAGGQEGLQLIDAIRAAAPQTRIAILSAYIAEAEDAIGRRRIDRVFRKPIDLPELKRGLEDMLGARGGGR